jgi:hypothetical protein
MSSLAGVAAESSCLRLTLSLFAARQIQLVMINNPKTPEKQGLTGQAGDSWERRAPALREKNDKESVDGSENWYTFQ